MGQNSSTPYSNPVVEPVRKPDPVEVVIGYVSVDEPNSLDLKKVTLATDAFARVGELKELAAMLKKHAVHHDINVVVNLGESFRPTGAMKSAALKHVLSNVFAGVFIMNLDIKDDFARDVDYWDKIEWWKDVQHFVTNMGFKFRKSSEITCYAVMPDTTFTINNQWPRSESLSHYVVNIDGFVFEE